MNCPIVPRRQIQRRCRELPTVYNNTMSLSSLASSQLDNRLQFCHLANSDFKMTLKNPTILRHHKSGNNTESFTTCTECTKTRENNL